MKLGYDKALYVMAFDHRASFSKDLFRGTSGGSADLNAKIGDAKNLIFEAFERAVARGAPRAAAGVLVDEQFGSVVARKAKQAGYLLAMPVERSGQEDFQFEYGGAFAHHIEAFEPDFAKVLVRYNAGGDQEVNRRQTEKLAQLSAWLHGHGTKFLFELLVPATREQLERFGGPAPSDRYDRELRPALVVQALRELQAGGVEPDIWKIEGLETSADCARVVEQARSGAERSNVACIVLGRGASFDRVLTWLAVAAVVPGFVGFAVGRTEWLEALNGYVTAKRSREETIEDVADRYLRMIRAYVEDAKGRPSAAAEIGATATARGAQPDPSGR